MPLLVSVATAVAFRPALDAGFVWDDRPAILNNAYVHGLGADQLRWMFTRLDIGHYQPISCVLIGAVYAVAGPNAGAYHVVGLILHVANTLLVYLLAGWLIAFARRIDSPAPSRALVFSGGVVALLFGLHPLRVEVVAWVTALRDLLCATFYLATVLCYLRAQTASRRRSWLVAAVVACALALLSKPMAVSLPVVLLILDVYPLRWLGGGPVWSLWTRSRRVLLEKLPFIVLAGAACVVAPLAEREAGALMSLAQFGIPQRLAQSAFGLIFYLVKTAVPTGLSPLYELPRPLNPLEARFLLSAAAVLLITALLVRFRRRWPAGLAVWGVYAVVLLPVLGLVHIGPFIAADRYTYLPSIALAVPLGGLVHMLALRSRDRRRRSPAPIALGGVLAVLLTTWGVLAFRQARVWQSETTLWAHAMRVDPDSLIAECNHAAALADAGELNEAWRCYQQMLARRQGYPPAVYGLAYVRAKQARYHEAIRLYRLVLQVMPGRAELHVDLADALAAVGRTDEAAEHYRRALEYWPCHARALDALARLSTQAATTRP